MILYPAPYQIGYKFLEKYSIDFIFGEVLDSENEDLMELDEPEFEAIETRFKLKKK